MGQAMSFGLTQYDVDELITYSGGVFSQQEIESLYKRFRSLDRGHKGYVSAEEFLNIPELSINPLAQRLERMLDSVNFKEFVGFLSAFSQQAPRDARLKMIFQVFDTDGDGVVSAEDLELMLRHLAGASLRAEYLVWGTGSENDIHTVVSRTMAEAGAPSGTGLRLEQFQHALRGCELQMAVDIPPDY